MIGIIIAAVGGAVILSAAGFICYRKFALPNMQPLSEQDLDLCRDIVAGKQGYPWICRRSLRTGECACFPCERFRRLQGERVEGGKR